MSSPLSAWSRLLCGLVLACPLWVGAQTISVQGINYPIAEPLASDQSLPSVAIGTNGGILVYQDNNIDGNGLGIAARRLDNNLSGGGGAFRLNQLVVGDQAKPKIIALDNGGYVAAWEGGRAGYQSIYVRFLSGLGVFQTVDIRVNSYTNAAQSSPSLAQLAAGNVVVVWSSLNQDGELRGVYGRLLNRSGQFVTAPFLLSQFTFNNQRDPVVTSLSDGNFVAVWVSENQYAPRDDFLAGRNHLDLYARIFTPAGVPVGDEFRVNEAGNVASHPAVARAAFNSGFTVTWSRREARPASWDIYARNFELSGEALATELRLNTHTYGDQYHPMISVVGGNHLVIWSSFGQDGGQEGVFGRLLAAGATHGEEIAINTETPSRQVQPTVAADSMDRFLVVWANDAGRRGFDLMAQRFTTTQRLPPMSEPWVSALSASEIMVTWPTQDGFGVESYQLYIDGNPPIAITSNLWVVIGLQPGSSHLFKIAYRLSGGQSAPPSGEVVVTTWDQDANNDGLPDDWQAAYWGYKSDDWAPGWFDSDGDGASNQSEFLAGTDPLNPHSVLVLRISRTGQGRLLRWNTMPGSIYQLQRSQDFQTWFDQGLPRLAAGSVDSLTVPATPGASYYRLRRLR